MIVGLPGTDMILVLTMAFMYRPRKGVIYDTYKYSKHIFRKTCRNAINRSISFNFSHCDKLFKQKRMGLFWNKIKKAHNADNVNLNNIGLASLEKHFTNKFSYNNDTENDIIMNARKEVTDN